MTRLAEAASINPESSGFARLAYADRLAGFFTTNATLQLEGFGGEFSTINGRSELIQAAMAARAQLREAEFSVVDVRVSFPQGKGSAAAFVVISGRMNGETNRFGQGFRMVLDKVSGRWLIREVATIENLQ